MGLIISTLLVTQLAFYSVHGDGINIVGYVALNDVRQHLNIDLDLQNILTELNSLNFTGANYWYSIGGSSLKTNLATRTIKGFSSSYEKLEDEKWYKIFKEYWNDKSYADTFTSSAIQGTGNFAESTTPLISFKARQEGCIKGAQYQNIWLYVIHEMEAAIVDCQNGAIGSHWDEAVAFYTGSIPAGDDTQNGYLLYGLAEKRCKDFGTCDTNDDDDEAYSSEVNQKVFELFEQGREYQYSEKCSDMETTRDALVVQLIIPLIQGTLKYLYFADLSKTESARSELWAFASALLPIIDSQSESVSQTLKNNALITNTDTVPDGYAVVKKQIESVYAGLGVECAQVGGLLSSTGYYPGMKPCTDNKDGNDDDNAFKNWGMALMISLIVTFSVIMIILIYYYRERFFQNSAKHTALEGQALKDSEYSTMHDNKI